MLNPPAMTPSRSFLASLALGALSAFAFQPVGWWPLMIVAMAALCELIARAGSLRRSLAIGWAFGLGQFCMGLNWIATAFTFQAAMPAWLGWIAVVLLSLYLAVYPMLAVGLAWRFGHKNKLALLLALAGSWAITEWLRATMFTGFAWNPIGVALVDTPWLNAVTHIGTYGLSAAATIGSGGLWLAIRRRWIPAGGIFLALALLLALPRPLVPDQCCLRTFDVQQPEPLQQAASRPQQPAPPAPPPVQSYPPPPQPIGPHSAFATGTVRVIQPNIGQADKWREGFAAISARRHSTLTRQPYTAGESPAEMIYWPEAAITEPLVDERQGAEALVAAEREAAASNIVPGQLLATGGLALTSADGKSVSGATNSVFVLDSGARIVGRYDKAHLVPYGEYLPMRPILSAIGLSRLAPGDLDFRPGPGPRTLTLPSGRKMGVQICYEIIFSGEVVERGNRPDHIFNPSNDAWFGAWGPPQHLAQARLRAAEEGLPVIRATPTGISAVIDARGRLLASVPGGRAGIIDIGLPMAAPPTIFARLGNIIPLALGFILLIAAIALDRRGRYRAI